MKPSKPFSKQLKNWLDSSQPKTILGLNEVFGEKSFAIAFLILLSIPALPLPTGGVTHIFEIIAMLLALEMMAGRRSIWLPKRWKDTKINLTIKNRTLPFLMRRIKWLERYSKPRLAGLLNNHLLLRLIGLNYLTFSLAAFLAPPFSGLDTLPSLGVIIISLGLVLDDILVYLAGVIIGTAGIALIFILGSATFHEIKHIF